MALELNGGGLMQGYADREAGETYDQSHFCAGLCLVLYYLYFKKLKKKFMYANLFYDKFLYRPIEITRYEMACKRKQKIRDPDLFFIYVTFKNDRIQMLP